MLVSNNLKIKAAVENVAGAAWAICNSPFGLAVGLVGGLLIGSLIRHFFPSLYCGGAN
jgi:hypothetical protein